MKQRIRRISMALAILILVITVGQDVKAYRPSFCKKEEWEVLRLTNVKRENQGLAPVSINEDLVKCSEKRAKEISRFFSHTRPNGESCFTVLPNGYFYYSVGENIAAGQVSAYEVTKAWWNSPGHKANMLNESYNHMGVGYYKKNSGYRHHWVQFFVGGCTAEKIAVNKSKEVLEYAKGTSVKDMKRYVIVTCKEHGKAYIPLSYKMVKGYKKDKLGTQTLKVKYKDLTAEFTVKIVNE